jgi:hypothetical protein
VIISLRFAALSFLAEAFPVMVSVKYSKTVRGED